MPPKNPTTAKNQFLPVLMMRGKVGPVNKTKWTCTVEPEGDGMPIPDVPIEPMMMNAKTGGGSFFMPEKGSLVWCCRPSTDSTPFVFGAATAPLQVDEGDEEEDPNDRRMNRPVLNEGDAALAVSEQGFIIMRKGGMLEVGASEACKRVYIPLTNVIREFSQGWEHTVAGNYIGLMPRDQDEVHGSENTPVEFQLKIREFAELDEDTEDPNDYTIDLRMGRIQDEEDELVVGGELGACVYRFNINDRYTVWIDREGNYQVKHGGVVKHEFHELVETTYNKNFKEKVRGVLTSTIQSRNETVLSTDYQTVGRDRTVDIRGKLSEVVGKEVVRTGGKLTEEYKGVQRTVKGTVDEQFTGSHEKTVGDTRNVSVFGDSSETIAGAKSTTVGKASDPNPLGDGYSIYVYNGVFRVHDFAGKVVFTSGTPANETALARITLKPTGAVSITPNPLGTVKFELNTSGVKLKTPAGEISVDNAGTVHLGVGPAKGAVHTTLTHPVCLMNGAPIFGCSSVRAGGIPEPGVPPVSIPSTFIPDPSP